MSQYPEDTVAAALARYYALLGRPVPPPQMHPTMAKFANAPNDATQERIRQNDQRQRQAQPSAAPPENNPVAEAFFSDDETPPVINVRRFNK